MDLLAIAALEAFDDGPRGQEEDDKTIIQHQQHNHEADSSMVVAGVKRKAEEGASAEISADDIDPSLSFEGPSHHQPPPLQEVLPSSQLTQPSRLSASLANILSGGASTTSTATALADQQLQHQQALPPLMSSPYRNSMPLASATASSPGTASTSSTAGIDMTMVYYGPPERLSEDSGLIRCICPYDDDDGFTIQCERCFAWLHGLCVDISPETVPDIYTCPLCVSGGKIARHVEARAARLQQLRKEAEDGLRRQRIQSNVTNSSLGSSSNNLQLLSSDPAVPTSELDEEYELLAKARGLAYQQSFDHNYTPTAAPYRQFPYSSQQQQQQPPPHRIAKPTQSPYYQREQLPVQQHSLGPSPFLHPPPQPPQSQAALPPHQQQQHQLGPGQGPLLTTTTAQQARRAGSAASNASNTAASTTGITNARRPKSSSPGGANVPQTAGSNAAQQQQQQQQSKLPKKRSSHAPQPSLPSIPQNSVLDSPGLGLNTATTSQNNGLAAPPPPKKRRSASAKEKEKNDNEVPPSVLVPTSGSIGTNASMPSQQQSSTSTLKDAMAQASNQPVRKTRLAAASISITSEVNGTMAAPSVLNKAPGASLASFPTQGTASTTTGGPPSGSRDAFLSDDEDSGVEDRFEPWQFEYTPVNSLRYTDRSVEQAVNELVEQFVEEERENLNGTLDGEERSGTAGSSRRASPFGSQQYSRNSSVRPSLLGGANSYLPPGIAHASRMASPVPSSGSSTPAYSSSGVASALAPPCLPVILPEPPISPSDFSSKLSVKPLATSSMSLAPPACTPFSGPTCVPSLMNPYPRPTIHGVFTSAAFSTGSLITFMNGEVMSGEQYRDDAINQWHDLGVMKCHTRGISQPWDLVLDQRRFADESRFIRNGCHPNVFVKPVLIRKSRNNDTMTTAGGKKARSAARRKADQQKAVQEGGEFELVFGLYALQDIAKREELVLPFDWADDHVVHSLHTLLFSPSLVFPTIPSNVESETEDDGIPSTSSFTHLTASQKGQIAQCTKHLYRLSRLASQTCLTLLGTSICACEKRRDCSIAWLWKLACFSESSSARSRGTIQLQDFDLNGLRAACSSALATDDKDWVATPGANGRMSNKKSSRKRRADLGALIGLARGWEKPHVEPISAIAPRLASEEAVESEEEAEQPEDSKMQVDEPEQVQETHTPTVERPDMDFGSAIQEDTILASVPTSAEVDKADTPFQFAPPVAVEESTLQSSAPIREEEEVKTSLKALVIPEKEVAEVSPMSTRPNTAQSTASDKKQSAPKPAPIAQEEDSDSDITEPLPSDHSDDDEPIKKPSMRKSPVKEMTKKLNLDKRKSVDETSKASRASPSKSDDIQVDDEEVVRPPKKKKILRKQEPEKPSKVKPLQKAKKVEEEEEKTPAKKGSKEKGKLKRPQSGDPATPRERPNFGGLPSFRTKKQIDQAKELAALKEKEEGKKPVETPPITATALPTTATAAPAAPAATTPAQPTPSQLDSLFDMPLPPVISQPKSAVVEAPQASSNASKTPQVVDSALPAIVQKSAEVEPASDAMQVDSKTEPMAKSTPVQTEVNTDPAPPPVVEEKIAALTVAEDNPPVPSAPAVRRVSFQAYKKRVSIVPSASSTTQDAIPEDAVTTSSPATERAVSIPISTPTLSIKPELPSEAVLGGEIVQTPIVEKTASQADEGMSKTQVEAQASPAVEASPAPAQSPMQTTAAMPPTAAAKPRLSFAAYRQRATTAPKPLPVAASPATVPAPLTAVTSVQSNDAKTAPITAKPAQTPAEPSKAAVEASPPSKRESLDKEPADVEMKKEEEEQEEGELVVDPNLEPGEVETEPAQTKEAPQTALGMRMGEFQQPDVPKNSNIKQSYTPPSRHRSLTPPKPAVPRQAEDKSSTDDSHQARPGTSYSASGKPGAFGEATTHATTTATTSSSNANWAPLGRDRPLSPVAAFERGISESSRYSANGASPPSHPRGFSRVSPRNGFQQPLPGSKPPTGPRSIPPPWPTRGRANSSSGPPGPGLGPAGRGGPPAANGSDAIYGGGFGTAGSGGSSYRPTSSGGGGRGDGHSPPPRVTQPPSGPRALQGSSAFPPPSRGRGRHDGPPPGPPRDRGWGGRGGRGRGRGGRERDGYY